MLGSLSLASAAESVLTIDTAASKLEFTLGATMHTVHGHLVLDRGAIRFDPATGAISGELVSKTASATTEHEGRDKKMHEDVLESAKFPEIVLVPKRVVGTIPSSGKGNLSVEANIKIHGSDHTITIPLELTWQDNRVTAAGNFEVPYVLWGMKDPSVFMLRVDKTVQVTVSVVGTLAPPSP